MDEDTQKQANIKHPTEHLRPWMFKKGQSGNPSGRPKGQSLKEYARNMLLTMNDEEKQEFLNGLNKDEIWRLAEGNPAQTLEGNPDKPLQTVLVKFIGDEKNKE